MVYQVKIVLSASEQASGAELVADTIQLKTDALRDIEVLETAVSGQDNRDILLTVGVGIDTAKLYLSADISYHAAAAPALDGTVLLDLSNWVSFTITSEDGTNVNTYRIKAAASQQAAMTAFTLFISGTTYSGIIDNTANTITISGVDDTNLTSTQFAPDITLSDGTTVCNPLSGVAQDFSEPVTYTVSGNGMVSRTYTVRVTNQSGALIQAHSGDTASDNSTSTSDASASTSAAAPQITAFRVLNADGEVDYLAGTVTVRLPYGAQISRVIPEITVTTGCTVSPVSGEVVNLSYPVPYTVTNRTETKTYFVQVVFEKSVSQQFWDSLAESLDAADHQVSRDPSGLSGR